jgi:hypothetical protein
LVEAGAGLGSPYAVPNSIDERSSKTLPPRVRSSARSGKVAKKVRQLNRELPEPGILLEQHQKVAGLLLSRFIAPKPVRFFQQRRQDGEKFVTTLRRSSALKVIVLKQWRDVARMPGTPTSIEPDWLVLQRMFDTHDKSPMRTDVLPVVLSKQQLRLSPGQIWVGKKIGARIRLLQGRHSDTFSSHIFASHMADRIRPNFWRIAKHPKPPRGSGYFRVRGVSMTDFLTNADHWRKRAERTRALAANAVKDQGRLLKVAEEYDRLATLAEGRRSTVPTGRYAPSSRHE